MSAWDIALRCMVAAPVILVVLAFGLAASGLLDRAPWGEQDVDGWRRVPRPNDRSRRSGRESW